MTTVAVIAGYPEVNRFCPRSPGGVLFCFSDGIPEAQNGAGDFYEERRLRDLLMRECERPAEAIVEAVKSSLDEFVGDTSPSDDITMLLLKRTRDAG